MQNQSEYSKVLETISLTTSVFNEEMPSFPQFEDFSLTKLSSETIRFKAIRNICNKDKQIGFEINARMVFIAGKIFDLSSKVVEVMNEFWTFEVLVDLHIERHTKRNQERHQQFATFGDRSASPPDSSLIWGSSGHSGWI